MHFKVKNVMKANMKELKCVEDGTDVLARCLCSRCGRGLFVTL